MLSDTVSDYFGFVMLPKNLKKADMLSAKDETWLKVPKQSDNPPPLPGSLLGRCVPRNGGFFLFGFECPEFSIPGPPIPGLVKGNIVVTEWMNQDERYIGFMSRSNSSVTMGWLKLSCVASYLNGSILVIEEIGSDDFNNMDSSVTY